jgi:Acyclic terpene utilisation family protein AtuA
MALRVLAFVNHIPIKHDPTPVIDRALEWGVDYIVAQGTGKDWGPHWLGSGKQFPVQNFVENVRPYVKACHDHGLRFVLSVGIAGARPQLQECVEGFNRMCAEEGLSLDVGIVSGDIEQAFLLKELAAGTEIHRLDNHPVLPALLRVEDVEASSYIVAQMGPEPIMAALEEGVDGVITGRALDVGLFMAPALLAGASKGTAALFGKLLECAGVALDPGDPAVPIYGEIRDDESILVRSPSVHAECRAQTLAAHSFYERINPTREENPGGYLDVSDVTYEQVDPNTVLVRGQRWVDTPYTVKLEGAAPLGYRAINITGVRDPRYLAQLDWAAERIKEEVRTAPRFAHLREGVDYHLNFTMYGRDAILGAAEPQRNLEHEVGVLIDVVAPTEEFARDICYFAAISHNIGPYPGRKTTASNVAHRFTEFVNSLGQIYRWSVWHLLPLEDPLAPFERQRRTFPSSQEGVLL